VVAGVTCAHAQQTITPIPTAPSLPPNFPQYKTYAACVMNCDTRVGLCQSSCSVGKLGGSLKQPDPNFGVLPGSLAVAW